MFNVSVISVQKCIMESTTSSNCTSEWKQILHQVRQTYEKTLKKMN